MTSRYPVLVPISILIALVLMLLPLPGWSIWLKPAWVLLVVLYWAMTLPYYVNVGTAWFVGILLDVLNGTVLGEHALAFTIVTYLVVRLHMQLRMYPLLQQSVWIGLFVLIYQIVIFCVQGVIGDAPRTSLYWLSTLTSLVMWPWVGMMIRYYHRRLKSV